MKFAIIGAGNMGGALARGLAQGTRVKTENICVSNPSTAKLEQLKEEFPEINITTDNCQCIAKADVVVLAVKPWKLADVAAELSPVLDSHWQRVCSMVGGVGLDRLEELFPLMPIYYLIPNTAIATRQSMTFIASRHSTAQADSEMLAIFRELGDAMLVEERLMNAGMVLASCGIAYALRYIRAATEGGVQMGFRAAEAQHIVAQTLRGAASLLDRPDTHPEAEIDRVTTPGGLTIRGLNAMEQAGFTNAVIQGLLAARPGSPLPNPPRGEGVVSPSPSSVPSTASTNSSLPSGRDGVGAIAIKVGSNILTRTDGTLDITRMSALVDQLALLRHAGMKVILISSGAVASGRSEMHLPLSETEQMDSVEQRQLFSAVGQAKLMGRYVELFRDHGIHVGQVLTTKENFSTPRQNENQRQCMQAMLDHDVLPIVNENDTVCVTELMFTDNDELSGLIARLMGCQALVILSNVDGLYDGTPGSPEARLIREVRAGQDVAQYISPEHSSAGRGGMESKCSIALAAAQAGIHVYIANGKREHVLTDLLLSPTPSLPFTHFLP